MRSKMFLNEFLKIKLLLVFILLFYKVADFCAPKLHGGQVLKNCGYVLSRDMHAIKGAEVEKVVLYSKKCENSDEKIIRNGVLLKRKKAKGTVLICHGFTCDKNDIGFLRYMFKDYNCMTFDFRAHGENIDGQCCTLGKHEAYDVTAAAKFLRGHPDLQGKPILVYGFSMGSVASIEAQAKDRSLFDAMILDCPFDSAENVIKQGLDNKKISIFGHEFNIPGKRILQKYVFHPYVQSFIKVLLCAVQKLNYRNIKTLIHPVNPSESIKKISIPCLFIYCKNDEKISINSIKSVYYNAASRYKKLWITNGRRHFDSFFYNPEKYTERIRKFTSKVIAGTIYKKCKHKIVEDVESGDQLKTTLEIGDIEHITKRGPLDGLTMSPLQAQFARSLPKERTRQDKLVLGRDNMEDDNE
ncbi:alpha/beta hydrolase [Candidatus Dependentiae bacterium]